MVCGDSNFGGARQSWRSSSPPSFSTGCHRTARPHCSAFVQSRSVLLQACSPQAAQPPQQLANIATIRESRTRPPIAPRPQASFTGLTRRSRFRPVLQGRSHHPPLPCFSPLERACRSTCRSHPEPPHPTNHPIQRNTPSNHGHHTRKKQHISLIPNNQSPLPGSKIWSPTLQSF